MKITYDARMSSLSLTKAKNASTTRKARYFATVEGKRNPTALTSFACEPSKWLKTAFFPSRSRIFWTVVRNSTFTLLSINKNECRVLLAQLCKNRREARFGHETQFVRASDSESDTLYAQPRERKKNA